MAAISPTVFKAAIKRALAEGEAKGRRLERCSNLRIFDDDKLTLVEKVAKWQRRWLKAENAARSKRGRRKA